jgi:hypothetical protein
MGISSFIVHKEEFSGWSFGIFEEKREMSCSLLVV